VQNCHNKFGVQGWLSVTQTRRSAAGTVSTLMMKSKQLSFSILKKFGKDFSRSSGEKDFVNFMGK
jgi:hypothetical protein